MSQQERVVRVIFETIDEVNQQLTEAQRVEKSLEAVLFGKGSRLDSLGLVSLIVEIEARISQEFGVAVTLADERAMSQKNSPFRTVGSLVAYIDSLLTTAAK